MTIDVEVAIENETPVAEETTAAAETSPATESKPPEPAATFVAIVEAATAPESGSTATVPNATETPAEESSEPVASPTEEIISDGVKEWQAAIDELEHEISDLAIEKAALTERSRSIKKRSDCLVEELTDLREQGPKPIVRKLAPSAEEAEATESTETPATNADASSASKPVQSDAWRSVKLADVLNSPIKGLGPKKKEALLDLCPTLGSFEDLRSRIGRDAHSLHELLPNQFGPDMSSAIEEAVLTWLTKNRDSAVFNSPDTTVAVDAAAPTPPVPANQQWDDMTDAQRSVYLTERAAAVNTGKKDCLAKKVKDGNYWESGYESFNRSIELIECPYTPGEWQDDWIRGYLAADALETYEGDQASDDSPANEEKPTAVAAPIVAAPITSPQVTLADL